MEMNNVISGTYTSYNHLLSQISGAIETQGAEAEIRGLIGLPQRLTSRKLNGTSHLVYSEASQILDYLKLSELSEDEFNALPRSPRESKSSKGKKVRDITIPTTTRTIDQEIEQRRERDLISIDTIIENSENSQDSEKRATAYIISEIESLYRISGQDYLTSGDGRELILYTITNRLINSTRSISERYVESYSQYVRGLERTKRNRDVDISYRPKVFTTEEDAKIVKTNARIKDLESIDASSQYSNPGYRSSLPLSKLLPEIAIMAETFRKEYISNGDGQTLMQYKRFEMIQKWLKLQD